MNYKVLLILFILFILSNLPRLEKLVRGENKNNKNCCDTRFSWQWPSNDYKDASISIYPNLINNYNTMYQGTTLLKNIKPTEKIKKIIPKVIVGINKISKVIMKIKNIINNENGINKKEIKLFFLFQNSGLFSIFN